MKNTDPIKEEIADRTVGEILTKAKSDLDIAHREGQPYTVDYCNKLKFTIKFLRRIKAVYSSAACKARHGL